MGLRIVAKIDGVIRSIDTAAASLKDLDAPLKRMGNYLQLKTQRRFANNGPGWPEVKKPQAQHRQAQSRATLERKLMRDVERAAVKAKNVRTIETRKRVLDEFRRLESGGHIKDSLLTPKQATKLNERIGRADSKARTPLGKIAASIKVGVSSGTLSIYSDVEWAGAHNDGATVGRGVTLPQREFLPELDDEDWAALESFIFDAFDIGMK